MTYFVPACVIGFVVLAYLVLKDIEHQYRELNRTLDALAEAVKRHDEQIPTLDGGIGAVRAIVDTCDARVEWVNAKVDALAEDFDRSQIHREMLDPLRYEPSAN